MRVLYITHYADLYGANLSMLNMILCLKNNFGVEPYVLLNSKGQLIEELEKYQINYMIEMYPKCAVNISKSFVKSKKGIKKIHRLFFYRKVLKKIEKINKQMPFHHIHSNTSMVDIGGYLSEKMKCPHIWHIREYGLEDYNLDQIDKIKIIRDRYLRAFRVIAISNSIKCMLDDIDENIYSITIYNGVNIPTVYEKKNCLDGKIHFCIVGLISSSKNQMEVVKAAKILLDNYYNHFCIHIVGEDFQNEKEKITQYIKENSLEKYVKFEDYQNNINEYLKWMDVGLMPSKKEAFGRVTIEYMCNYMPVIGSNSGGTTELIQNEYNGYLYEPENYVDLAECMSKLIDNTELLRKLGNNARDFAEQFSVKNNAEKVYEVYKEVDNGKAIKI